MNNKFESRLSNIDLYMCRKVTKPPFSSAQERILMKKQKGLLFFVLAVGCIAFISIIIVKKETITDDSEQVYTYEENSHGNETEIITENYIPTEK